MFATATITVTKPISSCTNPPNIPDINLQNTIKQQLEITENINCTHLESLKSLISGSFTKPDSEKIKQLNGLEHATNLKTLSLNHHLIEDLSPLETLNQLNLISLHDNKIKDISPLKNLINLEKLQFSSNDVVVTMSQIYHLYQH